MEQKDRTALDADAFRGYVSRDGRRKQLSHNTEREKPICEASTCSAALFPLSAITRDELAFNLAFRCAFKTAQGGEKNDGVWNVGVCFEAPHLKNKPSP